MNFHAAYKLIHSIYSQLILRWPWGRCVFDRSPFLVGKKKIDHAVDLFSALKNSLPGVVAYIFIFSIL